MRCSAHARPRSELEKLLVETAHDLVLCGGVKSTFPLLRLLHQQTSQRKRRAEICRQPHYE
jgi:hypothetical protein